LLKDGVAKSRAKIWVVIKLSLSWCITADWVSMPERFSGPRALDGEADANLMAIDPAQISLAV